jgi:SulP family sulfate permease
MIARCRRQGTKVILSGLRAQPAKILAQMGIADDGDAVRFADNFDAALKIARDG